MGIVIEIGNRLPTIIVSMKIKINTHFFPATFQSDLVQFVAQVYLSQTSLHLFEKYNLKNTVQFIYLLIKQFSF